MITSHSLAPRASSSGRAGKPRPAPGRRSGQTGPVTLFEEPSRHRRVHRRRLHRQPGPGGMGLGGLGTRVRERARRAHDQPAHGGDSRPPGSRCPEWPCPCRERLDLCRQLLQATVVGGWRARGWKNSRGEPVANQDLWRPLIDEVVDRRRGEIKLTLGEGPLGRPDERARRPPRRRGRPHRNKAPTRAEPSVASRHERRPS